MTKKQLDERAVPIENLRRGDMFRYRTSPNIYECLERDVANGTICVYNYNGSNDGRGKEWPFDQSSGREWTRTVVVLSDAEANDLLKRQGKTRNSRSKGVSPTAVVADEDDEQAYPEGAQAYRLHIKLERQRSNALVHGAKAKHFSGNPENGCVVCGFSFFGTYGELGLGFIEAHHKVHIKDLQEETTNTSSALAMVCSNCHRMLHKRPSMTVEELTAIVQAQKDVQHNLR